MKSVFSLQERLEMVSAEIKANVNTPFFGIRLNELRKQRDAIEEEIEDEKYFEDERGCPDMDGCEEYARRFAA